RTAATSGRAVLVAAVTVIVAMLGLYASGIGFIGSIGLAAAIAVAVAVLSALTLGWRQKSVNLSRGGSG
ncbi:MAG TPA: MMPL family transporter, partial [Streptosporangiaceae bacterium]|nr:MMPL family transporter [Streptosporangiaceae bacterium]